MNKEVRDAVMRERDSTTGMRGSLGLEPRADVSRGGGGVPRHSEPLRPLIGTVRGSVGGPPVGRSGNPHVHVRLSRRLLARLQTHVQSAGLSKSEIVRAALVFYLDFMRAKESWG